LKNVAHFRKSEELFHINSFHVGTKHMLYAHFRH